MQRFGAEMQVPYWGFISMLAKQENQRRPVILMDLPHVSMRVWPQGLDIDDVADALAAILASHAWPKACVVAHSYGTFIASRLCQLHPACVHATVGPSPRDPFPCVPFPFICSHLCLCPSCSCHLLDPPYAAFFSAAPCSCVLNDCPLFPPPPPPPLPPLPAAASCLCPCHRASSCQCILITAVCSFPLSQLLLSLLLPY